MVLASWTISASRKNLSRQINPMKAELVYYWACEACGASPIPIKGQRWFPSEATAKAEGKPTCPNPYGCHGLDRHGKPMADPIQVHSVPKRP